MSSLVALSTCALLCNLTNIHFQNLLKQQRCWLLTMKQIFSRFKDFPSHTQWNLIPWHHFQGSKRPDFPPIFWLHLLPLSSLLLITCCSHSVYITDSCPCQAHFCLRDFELIISSVWESIPQVIKCHPLIVAFPIHL